MKKNTSLIKRISKEMRKQDNRCTQYPLFVILSDVRRPTNNSYADIVERTEEIYPEYLCAKCNEKYDQGEDLPEYCDYCDDEAFNKYDIAREPQLNFGVFFTAKACEECIKANHYHFENPKSYGISAWRNYEMQNIMKYLLSLTGDIPSHYN